MTHVKNCTVTTRCADFSWFLLNPSEFCLKHSQTSPALRHARRPATDQLQARQGAQGLGHVETEPKGEHRGVTWRSQLSRWAVGLLGSAWENCGLNLLNENLELQGAQKELVWSRVPFPSGFFGQCTHRRNCTEAKCMSFPFISFIIFCPWFYQFRCFLQSNSPWHFSGLCHGTNTSTRREDDREDRWR